MVQLQKFDRRHYDQLIAWIDSAETLMQFAGPAFHFPLTKNQLDASISDDKRFAFVVLHAASKEVIGHAELYVTETSVFLGRILIGKEEHRGKGFGQAIVQQLLSFAFYHLQQSRAELNVFDWNLAAIQCYKKAGFAVNPDKMFQRSVNGQTWIALNMTIEKQEWEQHQQNKET